MGTRLKCGQLSFFNRGFISKKWKDGFFVLFEDSTISCYEKQNDKKPLFSVCLRDVCQFLCVGPFTRCVPKRPPLPYHGDENLLICFPRDLQRKEKEICWIICRDLTQMNEWMTMIVKTLPPPPQQPIQHMTPSNSNQTNPANSPSHPNSPPPIGFNFDSNINANQGSYNRPPNYPNAHGQNLNGSSQNHANTGINPPVQHDNRHNSHTGGAGANTTVIVQPGAQPSVPYGVNQGYSGGNLAMGMLAGAVLGGTLGYAWGNSNLGSGWGMGSNWGGGAYYGPHLGYRYAGTYYGDGADYTVNNYNVYNISDNDNYHNSGMNSYDLNNPNDNEHNQYQNQSNEGTYRDDNYNEARDGMYDPNYDPQSEMDGQNYDMDNNMSSDAMVNDYNDRDYYGGDDAGGNDYNVGEYTGGDYGGADYDTGDYGGANFGGGGEFGAAEYSGGDYGNSGGGGDW